MAQQIINIGSAANQGDGDPIRTSFDKVNDNFTELYASGIASGTITSESGSNGNITLSPDGTGTVVVTSSISSADQFVGDLQGSVFADNSTLLVDSVSGTIPASVLTGVLPALDGSNLINLPGGGGGIALTDLSIGADDPASGSGGLAYNNITGVFTYTPPDLSSYLTSETSHADVLVDGDFTSAGFMRTDGAGNYSIDANTYLTSFTETDPVVGAVNGIVKADGAGNISAAVAGTDYSTFDGEFSSLTNTPTTLLGYGITDALTTGSALEGSGLEPTAETADAVDGTDLTLTGGDANGLNSTGGDAIITGGSGALTDGNVLIGTTQTTQIDIGNGSSTTIIAGSVTALSTVRFQGNALFDTGVEEAFGTLTGSTGVTACDCNNGHIFYLTGATGDITANFTNLGLTAEYGTNVMVIINQGATPYEVTAVQIAGVAQTINWQGGTPPTGNANGIDSFSFTILNDGGTFVILGQMVDFT